MRFFGISECESHYLVRLGYEDKQPQIQKAFHWHATRSKERAFLIALTYRNKEMAKLAKKGFYSVNSIRNKTQRNNTSGTLGVSRGEARNKKGEKIGLFYWQATGKDKNGVIKNRKFSCEIYGEDTAFRMAVIARADICGIDIDDVVLMPEIKLPS